MPALSTRTANFTDSVIRRMTRISNQYGAVNLSQGFPDFEPPREILQPGVHRIFVRRLLQKLRIFLALR